MLALYNLFFLKVKFPGLTSWSKAKCDCLAQLDMWVLQPCNLCLEGRRGGAGKHFKWKLKQSNTEIKRHNWHSLTVPKFSEAFFQRLNIFLVFPLKKKKSERSDVANVRQKVFSAPLQIDEAQRWLPVLSQPLSHTHIHPLSHTHMFPLSPLVCLCSLSLPLSRSWSKRWSNDNSCALVQECVRSGWRSGVQHSQQHWTDHRERERQRGAGAWEGGHPYKEMKELYNPLILNHFLTVLKEYGGVFVFVCRSNELALIYAGLM